MTKGLGNTRYNADGGLVKTITDKNDFFYDPMHCSAFYRDVNAPVWFGRVENLSSYNQKLFVYGFVTSSHAGKLLDSDFEFSYRVSIRGKNTDSEEWMMVSTETQKQSLHCKKGKDFCTWFKVATLNKIEHDMYDVAVEVNVMDSPDLMRLEKAPINFRIAYVDEKFTQV